MRSLRFRVEALLFRTIGAAARVVPRRALLAVGALGGTLARLVDGRHRGIVDRNLRLAYGSDADPRRLREISRACWRHFGKVVAAALRFEGLEPEELRRLVRIRGFERLRAAHALGRGVLVFSGHLGNWELGAVVCGSRGVPLAVVARPLDNPRLERLLAPRRSVSGNAVIDKRRALAEMARALRRGTGVGVLIDQDARDRGVFVPFFGRPTSTSPALALLALRSGAPIVPAFCVLGEDGVWDVTVEPPLDVPLSGRRDVDVRRITAAATAVLESWIRRFPEQWLWMHRRWKTVPADSEPMQ